MIIYVKNGWAQNNGQYNVRPSESQLGCFRGEEETFAYFLV